MLSSLRPVNRELEIYNQLEEYLEKEKINANNFEKVSKKLTNLEVYSDKKEIKDVVTNEVIFSDNKLNPKYKYAKIFSKYIDEDGHLLDGHKLETKVTKETMPTWIAFGCYLMIGLGTLMGGWKIVKTMGTKITKVTPLEGVCAETAGVVVPANYNCPGQLVISGAYEAVEAACEGMKAAGAKRALILPVGGAFHSPLMEPAREKLAKAIAATELNSPICAIYQNVSASAVMDKDVIKENLVAQLTAPVKWTQSVQAMVADGATHFTEVGPGKVLQGLVKKIAPEVEAISIA
mgnify:CR=1 FL=1